MSALAPRFRIQGWCPSALQPMESGDGLVVRVKPNGGWITSKQAIGIAASARQYGNGLIDLSTRANLQLRGVTSGSHEALISDLYSLGLIDADLESETRRNVIVTPFADAEMDRLAKELARTLPCAPRLPSKFGFMVDCGPAPVMASTSADIRLERTIDGDLIVRASGMELGTLVSEASAPQVAIDLAHWFVEAGGVSDGRGRMSALIARGARPPGRLAGTAKPAPSLSPPGPGIVPQGALVGFEFGQTAAENFAALGRLGSLRITPWRMVLIEGAQALPDVPGTVTDASEPSLRVNACTGAPGCHQALGTTRDLARTLASRISKTETLHVSGCSKGCAHPTEAPLTVVAAKDGVYDLIVKGKASDKPAKSGLNVSRLLALSEFS